MSIENKRQVTLLSEDQIQTRIAELGAELTEIYKEKNLLVVSLLKGSFIFTADLVRKMPIDVKIEFMITSSYGHSEESSGSLQVKKDIEGSLEGYDVLIVDDITDSGITMKNVIEHLSKKGPKSIKSCVLLDKPSRRQVELVPDYVGFEIPDKFIVGYGLNYGDYFRNVPYVFAFED
ncbi:hypoxanthine phosphoribosyltransferase [Fusibacter sp. A1]|nr:MULTISPECIES: hypoxanthine phosphoribosyltransferase [unclassified Fusibacter]MCK8058328.1 hypoxanthine phosphoribosyltransferase [Fusibacter sp. A2]NPE20911.1 hypoxanthine phosphoribosyltransferase [Fusibacter sp. A1]RXV63114.1 hypoxanthine phosphoribosyltransferase [Fusibacter sp. A1]